MTRDFADFLDALNKEGLRYVVIGGMAARPDKDLPDVKRLRRFRDRSKR